MLTDKGFWNKVKGLENKTVCTLTRGKPNRITSVVDKCVHIAGRKSTIPFNGKCGLYANYKRLHHDKYLSISDVDKDGKKPNGCFYVVIMAIILYAVPDEAVKG